MENNITNEVKIAILKIVDYYLTLQQNNPHLTFMVEIRPCKIECAIKRNANDLYRRRFAVAVNHFEDEIAFSSWGSYPPTEYSPSEVYDVLRNDMISTLPTYEPKPIDYVNF